MRALINWGLALTELYNHTEKEIPHANYGERVTKGYRVQHWNGEGRVWVKNHTEIMMTRRSGHCTCYYTMSRD